MVQVSEGGGGKLKGTEADVVQRFIVQHEAHVGVLDKLVHGKNGVVGLHYSVGHLGGWDHGVGGYHAVGVLLTDLGDKEGSHTGASSSSQGVGELEALQAVTGLSLLADLVEDGVDELSSLGVVSLGPVVSGSGLAEDEVVGAEDLSVRSRTDGVHGSGLKVHEDGTGDVASAGGLVEVDVDPLKLKVGISVVGARGINSMFVADNFPEFGSNLVSTLTALDMNYFPHPCYIVCR